MLAEHERTRIDVFVGFQMKWDTLIRTLVYAKQSAAELQFNILMQFILNNDIICGMRISFVFNPLLNAGKY